MRGRLFEAHRDERGYLVHREVKPGSDPPPMIAAPWFGGSQRARPDGWRDEQSQTPITDILRGR